MFKHQMKPLSKGGQTTVHAGKGSQQAPLPNRGTLNALASPNSSMNNYAKASPISQPAGVPDTNLSSGDSPGIGG